MERLAVGDLIRVTRSHERLDIDERTLRVTQVGVGWNGQGQRGSAQYVVPHPRWGDMYMNFTGSRVQKL